MMSYSQQPMMQQPMMQQQQPMMQQQQVYILRCQLAFETAVKPNCGTDFSEN